MPPASLSRTTPVPRSSRLLSGRKPPACLKAALDFLCTVIVSFAIKLALTAIWPRYHWVSLETKKRAHEFSKKFLRKHKLKEELRKRRITDPSMSRRKDARRAGSVATRVVVAAANTDAAAGKKQVAQVATGQIKKTQ